MARSDLASGIHEIETHWDIVQVTIANQILDAADDAEYLAGEAARQK